MRRHGVVSPEPEEDGGGVFAEGGLGWEGVRRKERHIAAGWPHAGNESHASVEQKNSGAER